MKILLVEDEDPKREHIQSFIDKHFLSSVVEIARSVRSAVDILRVVKFDLILLDMSLPTFDIDATESGGRPLGSGGIEVMSYMEILEVESPVIVVTAYEAFSNNGKVVDLSDLKQELITNFPNIFIGLVYYNAISGKWVEELKILILENGYK